ncbi:hypothetical protein [Streptomyces sp. NPDC088739]|uniref:hypothetical protein n=1 Tax=Streptomyces sp. NPDC088739 TaxID=3365882 RepID=UPI00380708C8
MPYAHPDAAANWSAPKPVQLPDVRRKLLAWHDSPAAVQRHALLFQGRASALVPLTHGPHEGAHIMGTQEIERLTRARLYFVDEAMTAVVNRKAARPRPVPLTAARVPSPYGFLVFASPVGSYPSKHALGAGARSRHVPYVAVSWGLWDGTWAPTSGITPHPKLAEQGFNEGWKSFTGGFVTPTEPDEPQRYWFTAYTPSIGADGRSILTWDTEAVVSLGHVFDGGAQPQTGHVFVRATIAAWDLLTQEKVSNQPIVDIETIERKPVKSRQDARKGIEDGGDVLVVSATKRRRRPPRQRSGSGAGRSYTHRRWYDEHDRQHCMNPHRHREVVEGGGQCHHELITIPEHWRGDASLPVREKVIVLDGADGAEDAEDAGS